MAQYAVLIYEDEKGYEQGGQEASNAVHQAHQEFVAADGAALRGGNALLSTDTATSIRQDEAGGFLVTDGPFAETREALGGFYIIEAADLDEAIAVAKRVPARFGGVEVRPVMSTG